MRNSLAKYLNMTQEEFCQHASQSVAVPQLSLQSQKEERDAWSSNFLASKDFFNVLSRNSTKRGGAYQVTANCMEIGEERGFAILWTKTLGQNAARYPQQQKCSCRTIAALASLFMLGLNVDVSVFIAPKIQSQLFFFFFFKYIQ